MLAVRRYAVSRYRGMLLANRRYAVSRQEVCCYKRGGML